jgi:hypothetical protein
MYSKSVLLQWRNNDLPGVVHPGLFNSYTMIRKILLVSTFVAATIQAFSQLNPAADSTAGLKVYINCTYCYKDYLRTQITWANFVQDQFVSNVDLTITSLPTGSGGDAYQLQFAGKKELVGLRDTLKFTSNAINTENEIREMLLRRVKLGLVRYAACSSAGDCLKIESDVAKDSLDLGIGSNPEDDPWNAWVFRVGANGNVGAQKVYQSCYFRGSLSASQVKETHKLTINIWNSYSEQRYNYTGLKATYILRSQSASVNYVHSLNNHWSAGGFAYTERSDFSNYDLYQNLAAALEYNVFPYQDAQTRMLTFSYRVGFTYYDFQEETIFNKTVDRIPSQNIQVSTTFTKDWGQFSAGIQAASFLNDFEKNHLYVWSNFDIRIFKGLSANAYINYSIQRDQINIRLNGASQEEVLLRQQELLSGFELNMYLGLSYRFGSIYNNVVNPRFN